MKRLYLLIMILLMCSCASDKSFKTGMSTNLLDRKDESKVTQLFEENKIQNKNIFMSLVKDYNKEKDDGCGIKTWNKADLFKYDDLACIARYEKNHKVSDGNCRLTAYALIEDKLQIGKTISDAGSYLMLDMDVLETNKEYAFINENVEKFITLFNEIDLSNYDGNLEDAFAKKWKEYEINIEKSDVSLISVIMHDEDFDLLFVGHAGILIKMDNGYLFIEKIAFEEPYQFSVIKNKKDLKDLFKKRETYFANGDEKGPFVYENDELLFSY